MNKKKILKTKTKELVSSLFRNDYGEPFQLTNGQVDIFNTIWLKQHPRNQVISYTQYGKSDTVAMATLLRSITFQEPFAIVSGTKEKAMIIQEKVIQHIFDNELFIESLSIDKDVPLERLKRERSKDHITWKMGGEIKIFTANTRNKRAVKEALTGFGSPNIIEEEASLVPDSVQAMILRMLGGHKEQFLFKIGNPFYRNHFLRSWKSEKYNKLFINYKQGLEEGRISEEFVEEMRGEAFFDILYECKFPKRDSVLTGGYQPLINEELLESAFITEQEAVEQGLIPNPSGDSKELNETLRGAAKLGADYAGPGTNRSTYVVRWPKCMKLVNENSISDTMQQVVITRELIEEYLSGAENASLDAGGLGRGICDRLEELEVFANDIMFGSPAPDKKKFKNMRAYMYYELRKWLKEGGRIIKNDGFYELLSVNYKVDTQSRLKIQPKEELKKVMSDINIQADSPDVADAAALTFTDDSGNITISDFEII